MCLAFWDFTNGSLGECHWTAWREASVVKNFKVWHEQTYCSVYFTSLNLLDLTMSQRAFCLSFSNLANSRRSWMVTKSFQMSSKARPMRIMPAITPSTMASTLTGCGHSGAYRKQTGQGYYGTECKQGKVTVVQGTSSFNLEIVFRDLSDRTDWLLIMFLSISSIVWWTFPEISGTHTLFLPNSWVVMKYQQEDHGP